MIRPNRVCVFGVVLALGPLMACQRSDPAPTPSGISMAARTTQAQPAHNQAPVVRAVSFVPARPSSGGVLRAIVKVKDREGDPVALSYHWQIGGKPLLAEGARVTLPELRKSDRIELSVVASDGRSASAPFEVSTRIANRPPRIVQLEFEEEGGGEAGTEGGRAAGLEGTWIAVPHAEDADGDRVRFRYEWSVNGKRVEADRERFSKSGLRRGDVAGVRVYASDGESEGVPHDSAPIHIGNSSPTIVSAPPGLDASGVFHYALEATDRDGDRNFAYRLLEGPESMQLDLASGDLDWRPSASDAGRHAVKVRVEDRHGGASVQSFEISVNVEPAPASPR